MPPAFPATAASSSITCRSSTACSAPVCIIWGDRDSRAPAEVLDAYRDIPARMKNVEVHIFPGVLHGYMMRGAGQAFDAKTREFSMARANAILDGLRSGAHRQSCVRRRKAASKGYFSSSSSRVVISAACGSSACGMAYSASKASAFSTSSTLMITSSLLVTGSLQSRDMRLQRVAR